MKKELKFRSAKELPKFEMEIEERSRPQEEFGISTLAQKIPKLPDSKFFPGSCRNNSNPIEKSRLFEGTSMNVSSTQSINVSKVNHNNLSLQNRLTKEKSVNFSQYSFKSDQTSQKPNWANMPLPCAPLTVLYNFSVHLTEYEQAEILKYPSVYFIGLGAKKPQSSGNSSENYGFDDENGDYKASLHDHIAYRYEIFELLGKGSFGHVYKAYDYKHEIFCAVKIIKNKKRFNQQAAVEIDILRNLRKKDGSNIYNVVHIQSSFTFRNHICICFEMLSMNLYHFLKLNRFQGISMTLVKRFAIQILQALVLLYKSGIVHCDLKPENILLRQSNKSAIKVIDFGSSCFIDKRIYTYIQSRFYRAPEVILGINYGTAIDMWSFGCILVELSTGYPIFPGENENMQLAYIMEYLGVPPADILSKATRRKVFFDNENKPKPQQNGRIKKPGSKSVRELLKKCDEEFVKLIESCLVWDPNQRITPEHALNCEWLLVQHKNTSLGPAVKEKPVSSTSKNNNKKLFLFD